MPGWSQRKAADARGNGNRSNRERHTDAESGDNGGGLGIVAGLQRVVPAVEQLGNRSAKRDGKDCRNEESPNHYRAVYHARDDASVELQAVAAPEIALAALARGNGLALWLPEWATNGVRSWLWMTTLPVVRAS